MILYGKNVYNDSEVPYRKQERPSSFTRERGDASGGIGWR